MHDIVCIIAKETTICIKVLINKCCFFIIEKRTTCFKVIK